MFKIGDTYEVVATGDNLSRHLKVGDIIEVIEESGMPLTKVLNRQLPYGVEPVIDQNDIDKGYIAKQPPQIIDPTVAEQSEEIIGVDTVAPGPKNDYVGPWTQLRGNKSCNLIKDKVTQESLGDAVAATDNSNDLTATAPEQFTEGEYYKVIATGPGLDDDLQVGDTIRVEENSSIPFVEVINREVDRQCVIGLADITRGYLEKMDTKSDAVTEESKTKANDTVAAAAYDYEGSSVALRNIKTVAATDYYYVVYNEYTGAAEMFDTIEEAKADIQASFDGTADIDDITLYKAEKVNYSISVTIDDMSAAGGE